MNDTQEKSRLAQSRSSEEERRKNAHERNIQRRCAELLQSNSEEHKAAEAAAVLGYN